MIACAELASTERNAEELRSELMVTATRAGEALGCGTEEGGLVGEAETSSLSGRAPLVVLDDVDALPVALASQVAAFLSTCPTPVIVTCGRTPPRWLRNVGSEGGEGRGRPSSPWPRRQPGGSPAVWASV